MVRSRRVKGAECVSRIGVKRNARKVLVGNPEGKIGTNLRWDHDTKTYLKEVGTEDVDWINLAQNKGQWRAVVNTVMNRRVA
jgi:hypothetical protein